MSNRRGDEPDLAGFRGFLARVLYGQQPRPEDLPGYKGVRVEPGQPSIGPTPRGQRLIPQKVQQAMQDTSRPLGMIGRVFGNLGPGDADPTAMFGGAAKAAGIAASGSRGERVLKNLIDSFIEGKQSQQQVLGGLKDVGYFTGTHEGVLQNLIYKFYPDNFVEKIFDAKEAQAPLIKAAQQELLAKKGFNVTPQIQFPPAYDPTPRLSEKDEIVRKLMRELGMDEGQVSSFVSKKPNTPSWVEDHITPPRKPSPVPMEPERFERAHALGFDVPAFHGTGTQKIFEEASPFNWGSHFGTEKAATDRLRHQGVLSETFQGELRPGYKMLDEGAPARVIPVRLREDKSLIQMGDLGGWATDEVLANLTRKGVLNTTEVESLSNAVRRTSVGFGLNRPDSQVATKVIGTYLKKRKGINGFKYVNNVEDPGSESYVIFDPVDIKSAFAQFGKGAGSSADLMAAFALLSLGITGDDAEVSAPADKPK